MHSQSLLELKIQAIRANQLDPNFRPAKRTERGEQLHMAKMAEVKRIRNEQQQKRREDKQQLSADVKRKKDLALANKSIAKRAREIIQAKKMQRINSEHFTAPVNQGHVKNTRSTADWVFKPRPGGPDLTGKIAVRIDSKTVIYVSPEKDIQQVIKKWQGHINQ